MIRASQPAYLAKLNAEQRLAVEHGDGGVAGPLLIIAGAGSGKTNTLAHRVAHLIVKGADPRRILLMTFSRRAAAEMTRRVERIAGEVLGRDASVITDALTWAGTFHGIGARLLRDYALEIGLDPAFTIHDREDSADLMNLVRHELGFSKTESRFPTKGTCLAIYSRAVNAQAPLDEVLGTVVSLVRRLGGGAEAAVRRLCRGQAGAERARLRRSAALLGADGRRAGARRASRRALRPRAGRRIPGHQPAAGLDPAGAEAGRARADGGRRRRAVDLFVPRREVRNILDFPKQFAHAGRDRHARAQLSLDRADPRRRQCGDRRGGGALHQEPLDRAQVGGAAAAGHACATKPSRRTTSARRCWRSARPAPRSRRRPCCSAPRITAGRWRSS